MKTETRSFDLAYYRLAQAKIKLRSARVLLKVGSFEDALSRSYYVMFWAVRALLATKNLDAKRHSGVIVLFNQYFIKEGIVDKKLGKMIAEAKGIREESDYADYVTFTREDALTQIHNAKIFIDEVTRAVKKLDC